jgi:hypothetical protein
MESKTKEEDRIHITRKYIDSFLPEGMKCEKGQKYSINIEGNNVDFEGCGHKSMKRTAFTNHVKNHEDVKDKYDFTTFTCPYPDCTQEDQLTNFINYHFPVYHRLFICIICNETLKNAEELKEHRKAKHKDEMNQKEMFTNISKLIREGVVDEKEVSSSNKTGIKRKTEIIENDVNKNKKIKTKDETPKMERIPIFEETPKDISELEEIVPIHGQFMKSVRNVFKNIDFDEYKLKKKEKDKGKKKSKRKSSKRKSSKRKSSKRKSKKRKI